MTRQPEWKPPRLTPLSYDEIVAQHEAAMAASDDPERLDAAFRELCAAAGGTKAGLVDLWADLAMIQAIKEYQAGVVRFRLSMGHAYNFSKPDDKARIRQIIAQYPNLAAEILRENGAT